MAITLGEKFGRRRRRDEIERVISVRGTTSESAAYDAVDASVIYAPEKIDDLTKQDIDVEEVGGVPGGLFLARVTWKPLLGTNGFDSFSFNVSGGSQRITHSRQTKGSYSAAGVSGSPPDFKGAINVDEDGNVQGVQLPPPTPSRFTIPLSIDPDDFTNSYFRRLTEMVWTTNSNSYNGFSSGEVLFLGASGSRDGDSPWQVTLNLASRSNVANAELEGFATAIPVNGWDVLWVYHRSAESTSTPPLLIPQPVAAYVERVFDSSDFGDLTP